MAENVFDIERKPPQKCNVCGNHLQIKVSVDDDAKIMKWYYICDTCKTTSSDTLSHVETKFEEYTGE